MKRRIWAILIVFGFLSSSLYGCCYFTARKEMTSAEVRLSDLKKEGGPTAAPYEYCSAEAFFEISKMQFNENDYKAAKGFADRSKSAAEAGLGEVKKK